MLSPKDNKQIISEKLAIIHCEFNAIHPFREGNGRTIRLFLDLLAVNSKYKLIDYSKSPQTNYIKACIAGMQKNYAKMQNILYKGLQIT
jgi:cell filamentation protein